MNAQELAIWSMALGAIIAVERFPGRPALIVFLNALMGLPPVVVGLAVYLLLSRAGPLGPCAHEQRRPLHDHR